MLRKSREYRRINGDLLVLSLLVQLVNLFAAFILVVDQLKLGAHFRLQAGGQFQAQNGFPFGIFDYGERLACLVELIGQVQKIQRHGIGLIDRSSQFLPGILERLIQAGGATSQRQIEQQVVPEQRQSRERDQA